jgi:hypothetical protein
LIAGQADIDDQIALDGGARGLIDNHRLTRCQCLIS